MYKFYKILIILEILIIICFGFLIKKEIDRNRPLKLEFNIYKSYLERRSKENKELLKRVEYLRDPENFKKELKEKFNIVEPGERVIILPENF
ncbi:MAG: hypothetical protein ACK4JE_05000 [Endomicrobiia bacterium]